MNRRLATAALAGGVALAVATPASGQEAPIQPGSSITMGGGFCTVNWLYEGTGAQAGTVYAGTAAHCVDNVGQEVSLATSSLGTALERIGEVAFMGDAEEPGRDYAFIALDAEDLGQVDPAMAGHPAIPTGVSTQPAAGDLMQFSGHGVGFHLTQPSRQGRIGVLNALDDREHDVTGAVTPGDSGGPVANLSDGNTAFGIVNTVGAGIRYPSLTVVQAGEGGANLTFVLSDAASRGFTVELCVVGASCGS